MQDFVPNGTGNSRYLKSVENFKMLYPTYDNFVAALVDGTLPVDFNGINMSGIAQIGTALNKANLLTDDTAALFGLDTSAVPNDALAFLGRYNCHWWSVLHGQARVEYKEKRTLSAQTIGCSDMNGNGTVTYADSITIDQRRGAISLVSPKTTTFAANHTAAQNETVLLSLRGKYLTDIRLDVAPSVSTGVIVYVPVNAEYRAADVYDGYSGFKASTCYVVSAEVVNTPAGETTYVHSTDRNAYPDSGTVDSLTYTYLGIPFDNAVTVPKVATGSYTGTGTYGKSNPNSLTFGFVPKFVAFSSTRYTAFGYLLNPGTRAYLSGNATGRDQTVTWNNKTVSWYSGDAQGQLNYTNTEYYYIAIG